MHANSRRSGGKIMKLKIIEKLISSGIFTTEELEYILDKIIKEN